MQSIRQIIAITAGVGFGLSFTLTDSLRAEPGACGEIKAACRGAGFVIGGVKGDRLQLDCFNPIVQGTQRAGGNSRQLPNIPSQRVRDCQSASAVADSPSSGRSETRADGPVVHDSRLNVTWLADGNLAATQTFGVSGINKNGSMDYATAVRWVHAMNAFGGGGYLGHSNWQLPATLDKDTQCERTGRHGETFGFHCSGSALGSLYYNALGFHEPNTAVAIPRNAAAPFSNIQPYLYWSQSPAADPKQGFVSFSFNTGFQGANVWRNHLYVLPMIKGKLTGTPPGVGDGLHVNPGGQTVYDPISHVTWLADANLAAKQTFGVADVTADGSMEHKTALLWIDAMNKDDHGRGYLGQTRWELPETGPSDPSCSMKGTTGFDCTASQMGELYYKQLRLLRGESAVPTPDVKIGPFHNIQPYLYWACAAPTAQSACRTTGPADGFEWNFSFGNGFQGTNLVRNYLYVMVYYPGSASTALPR